MALSSPDYCLWGYLKEKSYHYTSAHNLQAGFVQPGNYRKSLYDFFKVLETNACHIEHAVVCACVCVCACVLYVMMLLISETAGRNEQLTGE